MSGGIKYIPLTFVSSTAEKERLIRNTVLLRHFACESKGDVTLSYYIDGTQYGFNASAKETGTNLYVRISDISNGEIAWETVPFCDCDDPESYLLKKHDIVVARTGGTTGKSYMVSTPPKGSIYAGYLIRVRGNSETNPLFLSVFLNSYFYWSQITSLNRDEFRPSVNAEKLKALVLPRFDRTLQDRIVRLSNDPTDGSDSSIRSELDLVLSKRNQHEEIVAEIEHQQSLLAKLKQAILQEAIQGKLTANWRATHPDVEPASQLLHRIQAEKARLIAAKKLRSEKPLPKITPGEIHFEIPKNWELHRLGELGQWCGGGTPTKDDERFWGGEVPWITPKDMKKPFLSDSLLKLTRIGIDESAAKLIPANSILFVVRGMILAHTFPVSVNLVETTVNQDMKALMPFVGGCEVFLRLLLQASSRRILRLVTKSTHGTRKLETEVYENFVIPLPPLAEQAAIVERVEALMTTCRALETEIEHARTHAAYLLQAVLKEAFAPAANSVVEPAECYA